jgi:D-amino-acid dehydrogenase
VTSDSKSKTNGQNADHVLIVGGGVIGAACAYYLAKDGRRVTIIDRGEFGKACSHGNCGFISPSHMLPLCQPGAISKTLRSFFDPDSPFRVKPSLNPSLLKWLWQFTRRCNHRDMMSGGKARHALLQSSSVLYRQLIADEELEGCEWEEQGQLFVFETESELAIFKSTAELIDVEFGVKCTLYNNDQLIAMEPALKPGLAGAFHFEDDAHLRPDRLLAAWKNRLTLNGVEIVEHCTLEKFICENGKARAVMTSKGEITAGAFIVATGAWSPFWNKSLGCKLPIQPGKGLSITMPKPDICPKYPMILQECQVGVTPFASGYRLGSTMEFTGYDEKINKRRLSLLSKGAKRFLVDPVSEPIEEEWYGFRPMSCDGVPIIDRSPAMNNVIIAAGHNMLGVSMSPATGKLVAEILNGTKPHIDLSQYRISRF